MSDEICNVAVLARRLGVTQRWLRDQADAGRVPSLRAGNRLIFNEQAVRAALGQQAARTYSGRQNMARYEAPAYLEGRTVYRHDLEAAVLVRCGINLRNPIFASPAGEAMLPNWLSWGNRADCNQAQSDQFDNRCMRAAEIAQRLTPARLCQMVLQRAHPGPGYPGDPHGRDEWRHMHDGELFVRAATTAELGDLFRNVIGSILLESHDLAADSTTLWTSTSDTLSFKEADLTRVAQGDQFSVPLPSGDTARHFIVRTEREPFQIARYARKFTLDEQAWLDDGLDALRTIATEMAKGAGGVRPNLVHEILRRNENLSDGVALFDASRNNTQGTSPLDANNLDRAIGELRNQRQEGAPIEYGRLHLIVPPALEGTGRKLARALQIDDSPVNLNVIPDTRLEGHEDPSSGTSHPGSPTTWYVASGRGTAIEVVYRLGENRLPSVRTYALSQGRYGMGFDCKIDIGAKATSGRGIHRNTA